MKTEQPTNGAHIMHTFTLPTGHKVTTQRVDNNIEFETRGQSGDVISSVRHSFAESVPLIKRMMRTA